MKQNERNMIEKLRKHGGGAVMPATDKTLLALEKQNRVKRLRGRGDAAHWQLTQKGKATE